MARILVDTSAVYALLDASDGNHAKAVTLLKRMQKGRDTPLLTNFLVAEAHGLLVSRLGVAVARRWVLESRWPVERLAAEDEERARDILRRFDDQDYSYVDATSFAVMERLKLAEALTFDGHFVRYGFRAFGS